MSKIIYCISVWADTYKALKKKIQSVITEMYRIVSGDYVSSVPKLHEDHEALSLDGWIQFMDVMTGRSIRDYIKPEDMSRKLDNDGGDPYLHNTRGRAAGMVAYTQENTSTYHPRWRSFLPRFVRTYRALPRDITTANLVVSSYTEKLLMKTRIREFIILKQIYY